MPGVKFRRIKTKGNVSRRSCEDVNVKTGVVMLETLRNRPTRQPMAAGLGGCRLKSGHVIAAHDFFARPGPRRVWAGSAGQRYAKYFGGCLEQTADLFTSHPRHHQPFPPSTRRRRCTQQPWRAHQYAGLLTKILCSLHYINASRRRRHCCWLWHIWKLSC